MTQVEEYGPVIRIYVTMSRNDPVYGGVFLQPVALLHHPCQDLHIEE